jgi:glycosyltransferase involved in cell wall biosynthesis
MSLLILGAKPTNTGGVESVIYNLNKNIVRHGFKITTLYMPYCYNKLFWSLKPVWSIQPFLRSTNLKFDLVHGHGDNCFFYSAFRRKNIPLVVTFHGTQRASLPNVGYKNQMLLTYLSMPEKVAADACDVAIACSKGVKDELVSLYNIPSAKIQVIYNGVDTAKFRPTQKDYARDKLGLIKNVFYGLWIGKEVGRKGLGTAITACRKANCVLLVAGVTGESSDSVKYLGKLSDDLMPILYNAANFFIYPSKYEGHPIVCLEALSCGLPLIVSQNSKVEIIKEGSEGFVIPSFSDCNLYAEKIVYLLKNRRRLDEMANNARIIAEKFSWSIQTEKYLKIYKELMHVDLQSYRKGYPLGR